MAEVTSQLRSSEEKSRSEREKLRDQLHHLSSENASAKLDNQKLKVPLSAFNSVVLTETLGNETDCALFSTNMRHVQVELSAAEEKLRGLQMEARQLKSSIRKYENLVEKYKKKVVV